MPARPISPARLPVAGSLLVALALAAACAPPAEGPPGQAAEGGGPADVVLVTADTLRHDATGFSGSGRVATPLLDRLAAGGTVFASARAHAVVTLPSHASVLTGLYPYQHGIHDNAGFVLGEGIDTLATRLRAAGYATAAFVSAMPLDRRFGLDRGFEVYDDEYEGHGGGVFNLPERPGSETVSRAVAWWEANAGRRRFVWVHLFTPHFPYAPSEPFASRYAGRPYYGDVAMMDDELRPLLEPLLEAADGRTLVVFTSDHGEALGEHGEQTHGTFAYDATLKIPLVFWRPGRVPAATDDGEAWHVDVVPTVLDLLGLDAPGDLPGRPLFSERGGASDRAGYFEALGPYFNRGWAPLTGRMAGGRKAIRLPLPELYDLGRDPGESDNRIEAERAEWERLLEGVPPLEELLGPRAAVDEETLERLRSLGYVAGNAAAAPEAAGDPARDPKNLVELEQMLDGALTAYHEGDLAGAESILRELLRRQPDMLVAHAHLATLLVDAGRAAEAIDLLETARRRGVTDEGTRRGLALALLHAGQPARALEVLGRDRTSRDPQTLAALGRVLAGSGRPDEARAVFARALEIDPSFPAARVDLAILDMTLGRVAEARAGLEAALARDPYHAEGWNALGAIEAGEGRTEQALRCWERAVELDPRLPDALYNLAAARARRGEIAQAIEAMRRYSVLVDGEERRRALEILEDLRRRAASPS